MIIIGFRYLSVIIMFESCEEKKENKEGCNQRELTKTYGLREVLHNYSCVRCCDCVFCVRAGGRASEALKVFYQRALSSGAGLVSSCVFVSRTPEVSLSLSLSSFGCVCIFPMTEAPTWMGSHRRWLLRGWCRLCRSVSDSVCTVGVRCFVLFSLLSCVLVVLALLSPSLIGATWMRSPLALVVRGWCAHHSFFILF